jgi:type I restriction enzyme R subunit
VAFNRPEYRVMIVANKFQTGFDQPLLVAMYIDKKIGNDIEIVQTFSRLNRTSPGKEQVFIVDFVNDPDKVQKAFAAFDKGALIEDIQDFNVIYEIKQFLDDAHLYNDADLEKFKKVRFKNVRNIIKAQEPEHKHLYDAIENPVRVFNNKQKELKEQVEKWEIAYNDAFSKNDKDAMKEAKYSRDEYSKQLDSLMLFKKNLSRFCHVYAYVAQLIDLGDPELENFSAFVKLLHQRLKGLPQEEIDLTGVALTGYEIKSLEKSVDTDFDGLAAKPIEFFAGEGKPDYVDFLKEIIERLNCLFGDIAPSSDQAAFTNHISAITRENEAVVAQVKNNPREVALKGNIAVVVANAVVRAMSSDDKLSSFILKSEENTFAFTNIIFELIKNDQTLTMGKS